MGNVTRTTRQWATYFPIIRNKQCRICTTCGSEWNISMISTMINNWMQFLPRLQEHAGCSNCPVAGCDVVLHIGLRPFGYVTWMEAFSQGEYHSGTADSIKHIPFSFTTPQTVRVPVAFPHHSLLVSCDYFNCKHLASGNKMAEKGVDMLWGHWPRPHCVAWVSVTHQYRVMRTDHCRGA